MGFFGVVLILAAICGAFSLFSIGLYFILKAIHNPSVRKAVYVAFCIFFLPCILFLWSVDMITETERKLWHFSYSLRSRSRLVLLTTVVYVIIYYALYRFLFM